MLHCEGLVWEGPLPIGRRRGGALSKFGHVVRQGGREVRGVRGGAGSVSHTVGRGLAEGLGGGWAGLGYRFSAFLAKIKCSICSYQLNI